jgi:hypothetical protein
MFGSGLLGFHNTNNNNNNNDDDDDDDDEWCCYGYTAKPSSTTSEMTVDKNEDKCSKTRVAVLCQEHNEITNK